jgi:hypothetical protein
MDRSEHVLDHSNEEERMFIPKTRGIPSPFKTEVIPAISTAVMAKFD